MIMINLHLLAILPLILFTVATAVRFSFFTSTQQNIQDEFVKTRLKDDFLFSFVIEATVLGAINGIILAMLSSNFGAGIGFLIAGLFLGIFILTLLRNGYSDFAEYFLAIIGLLFLYEFVYFLFAGSYARVFGSILIGWQIAVIWYFGFIGACIGLFIFYIWFTSRGEK